MKVASHLVLASLCVSSFSGLLGLASLTGCGGGTPPPEAPPAPAAKAAEKPVVDLGPVPEPAALVLQARIGNPAATVKTVAEWAGAPAPTGELVSEAFTDVAVGDVLDLTQPIDVAVTVQGNLRPDVVWATSAAIVTGDATMAKFREHFTLTAGPGGITKLEPKKDEDTDRRCALFPTPGVTSSRLVCGDSERALRELGPYLARTRTRVPVGKDLEIDVRGTPVRELLTQGKQLFPALASSLLGSRTGNFPGLGILVKAVVSDAIDLGLDIDTLHVDSMLGQAGIDGNAVATLSGSASTIGRIMTGHPEKAGPPPAAFAKLPGDAESASYGRGWDANDLSRPKEVLFSFTRSVLQKEGLPEADSQALEHALSAYLDASTNGWVSASGSDWAQAGAAVKKLSDLKHPAADPAKAGKATKAPSSEAILEAERAALEKLQGWSLWGAEVPVATMSANLKELVAAYNRPALQKAVKGLMHEGVPAPTFKNVPVSAAAKLPKDTLHFELSITRTIDEQALDSAKGSSQAASAKDAKPGKDRGDKASAGPTKVKPKLAKPVKVQIYLVPDGSRTWMGWGIDDALVTAHLRTVLTEGESNNLATREGLAPLRDGKWNSAGFIEARSLARGNAGAMSLFESAGTLRVPSAETMTGDFGTTPLWFGSHADANGKTHSVSLTVKVPRETIQDLTRIDFGRGRRRY